MKKSSKMAIALFVLSFIAIFIEEMLTVGKLNFTELIGIFIGSAGISLLTPAISKALK